MVDIKLFDKKIGLKQKIEATKDSLIYTNTNPKMHELIRKYDN